MIVTAVTALILVLMCTACVEGDGVPGAPRERRIDTLTGESEVSVHSFMGRTAIVKRGDTLRMYRILRDGSPVFERIDVDTGAMSRYLDYHERGDIQALVSRANGLVIDVRWTRDSPWIRMPVPLANSMHPQMYAGCHVLRSGDILITRRNEWALLDRTTRRWRVLKPHKTVASSLWYGVPEVVFDIDDSTYLVGHDVGEWGGSLSMVRLNGSETFSVKELTKRSCSHIEQVEDQTYLAAGGIAHLGYRRFTLDVVRNGVARPVSIDSGLSKTGPVFDLVVDRRGITVALGAAGVARLNLVESTRGYRAEVRGIDRYPEHMNRIGYQDVTITSDTAALTAELSSGIFWMHLRR